MGTFAFDPAGATASITLSGGSDKLCIDLIEGFRTLPDYRGRDWIVPRLDGEQPGNRRKGKLILPAAGYVQGLGSSEQARRDDMQLTLATLMTALDPSLGVGVITLAAGYLGVPSGDTATISARVRNVSPGKMQRHESFQLWTIEFEAYTPTWVVS